MEDYEYDPSCGVCGAELVIDSETGEEYCPDDPDHTFLDYEMPGLQIAY